MTPRSILVPYDGSRPSQAALQAALRIAEVKGAKLKGLFVMDQKVIRGHLVEDLAGLTGAAPFMALELQSRKTFAKIGKSLMASFEKQCAAKKAACETSVVEDSVGNGITAAARKADLVILGQRGSRAASGPIGSNVERVVRHSPVPVLVVPQDFKNVRRVLAGYDGSVHGKETLSLAMAAASWFDAVLTVLHVSSDSDGGKVLALARKLVAKRRPDTEFILDKGDPASALARIAHSRKYDLLVMGAYGQGFLREYLLGSATDLVLRETRTPLLIHR